MKYFIVIHINNEILRTIIDGIRLFSDPTQKHEAHITVRGPYESKTKSINDSDIQSWQKVITNTHILVNGIDTFFNTSQNTVFFKCESAELKEIWWKKNFKGFNPHITIYDKSDRSFASNILDILSLRDIKFRFKVKTLDELVTQSRSYNKKQPELFDKRLLASINYDTLSKILKSPVSKDSIFNMTKLERLNKIESLGKILTGISDEEQLYDANFSDNLFNT